MIFSKGQLNIGGACVGCMMTGISLLLFSNCRSEAGYSSDSDVMMASGDSLLRRSDVVEKIPPGLDSADSLEMFNRIVQSWIRSNVLLRVAKENLESDSRIEELVEEYRNRLIINAYLQEMCQTENTKVTDAEKREYFSLHKEEMILERPLIRGIYIKLPDDASRIEDIRRWMKTGGEKEIKKIERHGLAQALQYEYFVDKWVDWDKLASEIPYRFFDADAFLTSTDFFETDYDGASYFLKIKDYMPTGSPMPYEVAEVEIGKVLAREKGDRYIDELVDELTRKAIDEGKVKIFDESLVK